MGIRKSVTMSFFGKNRIGGRIMLQYGNNPVANGISEGLKTSDEETLCFPSLLRVKTGEKVAVRFKTFRIGRCERVCDYALKNDRTISRQHADIILKGDCYYIMDKHSTNKTYLNGKELSPMIEYALKDGDRIMLANEEFIFGYGG